MYKTECAVTGRKIRDPLCVACLEEQVEQWIAEKDQSLVYELRMVADEVWMPAKDGIECMKCGMPANVCEEYFARHVMQWLTKHPRLLPEFVRFFNCTPLKTEIVVVEKEESKSIRAIA